MKSLKLFSVLLIVASGNLLAQTYTWTQKNDFPIQRYAVAAFSIGTKGYFVSGCDYPNSITYNDSWEYEPSTDTWTQKASMPASVRYGASAFAIDNFGYVGCGWSSNFGATQLKDFWKYDPANNLWTQIPDLPGAPRYTAFGISDGIKGYVGLGYSPLQNDCYAYDPQSNSWSSIPNFPGGPRQAASTFCINGLIYVCGGADASTTYNDCYMYNPATNTWTQKATMPGPGRDGSLFFALNNHGFVGSGYVYPVQYNNDFYIYDPVSDSWTMGPTWPAALRIEARAFVINNQVFVGCGYLTITNQCFKDVWTLTEQGLAPAINIASTDSFWCDKASVDFYDLSTNNPTSWQWYFQGAVPDTSTLQNPTGIYYPTPGNYDVKLVACNASACDSITFTSFINEYLPPPAPVITQSFDTLWSSAAYAYQWFDLNNPSTVVSINPYLVVSQPGSYFVIISDSLGCITPSDAYVFTAIDNLHFSNLGLNASYNNEHLTINASTFNSKNVKLRIVDSQGKLIRAEEFFIAENKFVIPFEIKTTGVYFLILTSQDQSASTKFLIK